MIKLAILYYLACGDIEATLYDIGGNEITVVDLDPKGAALIAWLLEQADEITLWDSAQGDVVSVSHLTF